MKNTNFSPVSFPVLPGFRNALYILLCVAGHFLIVDVAHGQTNTWDGSTDNNWNVAANWSQNAVPTAAHDVVINGNATIILGAATYTINSLTVSNAATVSFTTSGALRKLTIDNTGSSIGAGSTLTLAGGASGHYMEIAFSTASSTMDIAGDLVLASGGGGGRYTATNSLTTVSGSLTLQTTLSTITSTASNLTFEAGGTYEHAIPGGAIPTATWSASSTCLITGSTSGVPGGLAQNFGNLIFNCPGYTSSSSLPSGLTNIAENFEILNTGTGTITMNQTALSIGGDFIINGNFTMASNTARTITVTGDLTISAGTITMTTGSAVGAINVTGNVTLSGGTITETGGGSGAFNFNLGGTQVFSSGSTVANTINFTVSNGTTLQMATPATVITGAGIFTLSSGATLGVTSDDGINTSGPSGNIQTGTRTFVAGSNIIYNGTANQDAGSALAITNKANLLIDNPGNTVTLSGATVISGTLTVTAGSTFSLSSYGFSVPTEVFLECGASAGSDISGTGQLTLGGEYHLTDAAGAGTDGATISCPIALGSNRTFTVVDDGSGAVDLTVSGAISGLFGIYKDGAGTLKMSGANTYSGATTINVGSIVLDGAAERISNTSALVLNGGTFSSGESTGYTRKHLHPYPNR